MKPFDEFFEELNAHKERIYYKGVTPMDNFAEIRARVEKATPGPWYWDSISAHKAIILESVRWKVMDFVRYGMNGASPRFLVDGIMVRADELLKSIPGKEHHRGFDDYIDHPDADFIAHARTDIPLLLSEIDRLNAENAAMLEDIAKNCNTCKNKGTSLCPGGKCSFQGYDYWQYRSRKEKDNG